MNIFKHLGTFFKNLFKSIEKEWLKLSPELQDALKKASGIVATINEYSTLAAPLIVDILKKKFPDLTEEQIHKSLLQVLKDLNIATDLNNPDIVATIQNIQKYLATKTGTGWEKASSAIAQIIAIFLAPAGTRFGLIVQFIEFVYQRFFKK